MVKWFVNKKRNKVILQQSMIFWSSYWGTHFFGLHIERLILAVGDRLGCDGMVVVFIYQFCCLTKPSSSWQIIIRSSVIDSAVFQQGLDSMLFNHAVVVWSVLMYNTMVHIILTPSILVSLTLVITIHWMCDTQLKWGQGYGIKHPFQQYFSYIVAVSFIGGGNQSTQRKPPTCHKSLKTCIWKALNPAPVERQQNQSPKKV
jgi:hypothetical protein